VKKSGKVSSFSMQIGAPKKFYLDGEYAKASFDKKRR
jgi:hypothetical protein